MPSVCLCVLTYEHYITLQCSQSACDWLKLLPPSNSTLLLLHHAWQLYRHGDDDIVTGSKDHIAGYSAVGKGKVFPYSLPSVGPGADPGVQAVSPQVT